MININEMAYTIYQATINPKQRVEVEQLYGKKLHQYWNKLNELCMDLKQYYKMKSSNRKAILTTLERFYGYEIPMSLDFLNNTEESAEPEPEPKSEPERECEPQMCTDEQSGNTVYDMDWL